jgi:hypothetical protein
MSATKRKRAAQKAAVKLHQAAFSAKQAARDRMRQLEESHTPAKIRKMVKDNERVLKSLGKTETAANGVTVYATKPVAIEVKQKHTKGAKPGRDNECPVARALRDSFLGAYITDAHVGNTTVKVWSDLNPDIEVKYTLDARLYGAVKVYDKLKRWPLEDGIYWLNIYPPSLRRGYRKPKDSKPRVIGKRKKTPSRHISLRSDLDRARAVADRVTKGAKKRA